MKLVSRRQLKDVEEEQVTLLPEEPEDMVGLADVDRRAPGFS
jgi:hypothetical protein